MHLQLIQNINDLEKIGTEWNQLLTNCSASHVPFLRHEFLYAWWKNLGGGEWQEANLYTILGRSDNQNIGGIAPLFFTKNLEDLPALMLLGSIEIADYLDFIAKPEDLPPFIDSVFDLLNSEEAPDWQVLDFYNIPEESPTLPALQRAAEKRDWAFSLEKLQPCPYIPLPDDWEEYLAGIDKKQRHEIRRKLRRAENYELPVRWFISEQEETLAKDIEAFFSLMMQDTEKEAFLSEAMRSHLQETIQAAFKAGWLQLAFLEIGGEKAAGYLNFNYNDHIWVYNSGLNYKYGNLSPGWVLLSELIKWAIENKRTSFDFMRGDEKYKYKFGGIDRFVMRASISRKG
jgi:CelD/BcsL family acetyltransferase involved in cellulose biosynthesis